MSSSAGTNKLLLFFQRYQRSVASFILSLYCLPLHFSTPGGIAIETAWKKALNYSIRNGFVFGRDFVFTYGPLGYLSTRYTPYVNDIVFAVFDVFLFAGFYYFIFNYLLTKKGWFFITLFALVLLRGSNYSQVLFLVFVLFTALNFKNDFKNYFELIYCSVSGVLLFFIKLNYGFVSLVALIGIGVLLLIKKRKAFLIWTASSLILFYALLFSVHMSISGYLKFGYLLIKNYAEAMYIPIEASQFPFSAALILILLFLTVISIYALQKLKARSLNFNTLAYIVIFLVACFLFYKNGFTRADAGHWHEFFAVFPFFIVACMIFSGFGDGPGAKIAAVLCLGVSAYGSLFTDDEKGLVSLSPGVISNLLDGCSLKGYFSEAFADYEEEADPKNFYFPENVVKSMGNSAVDIFPDNIELLLHNNLTYVPRPVPQSYSAYSETLDSLNASHFSAVDRPGSVVIYSNTIDHRYPFWDESITKATLHLNYTYNDFMFSNPDGSISTHSFLVLKSNPGRNLYPRFEEISRLSAEMGDVVKIHFPGSQAIYVKADIRYTVGGLIKSLFYQPPPLNVTLYFIDGSRWQCKAVVPVLRGPVLINKPIINSLLLKAFLTGNLTQIPDIVAFSLDPAGSGFEQTVQLTFLKFSNY